MPSKKTALVLLAALGAVLFASFVGLVVFNVLRQMASLDPKDRSFRIDFPEHWERVGSHPQCAAAAVSPLEGPDDAFRENVNVVVERHLVARSLDEYRAAALASLRQAVPGAELLEQGPARLAGREAWRTVYRRPTGALRTRVLSYMVLNGRKAYVVTCTAEDEAYGRWLPELERVARTLVLD